MIKKLTDIEEQQVEGIKLYLYDALKLAKSGAEKSQIIIKYISEFLLDKFIFKTIIEIKNNEIYIYNDGIFENIGKHFIEEVSQIIYSEISVRMLHEIVKRIERESYIERENFGNSPLNLICVKNGVIDISNIENIVLLPHSPSYMFLSKINAMYDKNATCEKILDVIYSIVKDEDIPCIQEIFGDLLQRTYKFKKATIFKGPHNSGKSQIMNILTNFIGKKNSASVSMQRLSEGKWQIYDLYKKHANICDELSEKAIEDVDTFKYITGGSSINSEIKFGGIVRFINYAKLIFACNRMPDSKKSRNDEAYYNRWMIFTFDNNFVSNDKNFELDIGNKVCSDSQLSGLLNWALEGLRRLTNNNKFSYLRDWMDNKLLIENDSNSIASFVNNILFYDAEGIISKQGLYDKYVVFTQLNNLECFSIEKFGREFKNCCPYANEYGAGKMQWKNVNLDNSKMYLDLK